MVIGGVHFWFFWSKKLWIHGYSCSSYSKGGGSNYRGMMFLSDLSRLALDPFKMHRFEKDWQVPSNEQEWKPWKFDFSINVRFMSYSKFSNWHQISKLLSNFGCLFTCCYFDRTNSIKTNLQTTLRCQLNKSTRLSF